jgi:competence protein ComEC
MIAGAAAWLAWPSSPPVWLAAAGLVVAVGASLALSVLGAAEGAALAMRCVAAGVCAIIAAAALGFGAAELRGLGVAQSAYVGGAEPVRVEGWVVANDASDNGPRLRLLVRSIGGVADPPRYVRVSVSEAGLLSAGRAASCRAVLGPPSGPMAPGAYDFARRAYFERLGATGFAYGRCRPANFAAPEAWLDRQRLRLAALRADLAAAIVSAAPDRGGAIAAALVTGNRSSIDPETNAALRDSGLGHLLSVWGVHMCVVGGVVFAVVLWVLSLVGPIALGCPVKKFAASGALVLRAA